MPIGQIAFLGFAVVSVIAALRVVTSRRVFHAALWLIAAFFGVAAIYMLLESPFMAAIQIFLYIGGVAVLTVIAIMVTKGVMREDRRILNRPVAAGVVSLALFVTMVWMIIQLPLPEEPVFPVVEGSLSLLGAALVDPKGYLLPFEVVSVMLLAVLVVSLYLGKER